MLTKLFLLLFSCTLLLQSSCAEIQTELPDSSTDSTTLGTSESATDEYNLELLNSATAPGETVYESNLGPLNTDVNGFFPNLRLLILMAQDFYPLIFKALGSGQQLFVAVIDDLNKTENITEKLQIKLDDLSSYIVETDKFSDVRDFHCYKYIEMLENFILKLIRFNATTLQNPSPEDVLIDAALRKNGLQRMKRNFALVFTAYLEVLSEQLLSFESLLVGKELALDKDIQMWIVEIKDMIKRIGYVVLFLEAELDDGGVHP